jgi:hypothetical protein
MRCVVQDVEDVANGHQATFAITLEREHQEKPACIVEQLARF